MLNYSVYPNFEEEDIGVDGWSKLGDGIDFLGKHGAEFVIIWPFVCSEGMPMHSRLFALMNDQHCFGFVFRLSPMCLFRLSRLHAKLHHETCKNRTIILKHS